MLTPGLAILSRALYDIYGRKCQNLRLPLLWSSKGLSAHCCPCRLRLCFFCSALFSSVQLHHSPQTFCPCSRSSRGIKSSVVLGFVTTCSSRFRLCLSLSQKQNSTLQSAFKSYISQTSEKSENSQSILPIALCVIVSKVCIDKWKRSQPQFLLPVPQS